MHHDIVEHPPDGSPMILVPAGPFVMGLPANDLFADDHEKPRREVYLSDFWMDVYPVTNARFARFVEAGGYETERWWAPDGWTWQCRQRLSQPLTWGQAGWEGPEQPVAGISWYEADAYARWVGRRLPTDAEWEKAARGTDGRRYPWGDAWPTPQLANFNLTVGRTTPSGLYLEGVSPFGCHDMAGNVNNWTSDWYWPEFGQFCVEQGMLRNPQLHDSLRTHLGSKGIIEKVDRGGGFATPREYHETLGCTRKVHWTPETREPWNGFRTAKDGSVSSEPGA